MSTNREHQPNAGTADTAGIAGVASTVGVAGAVDAADITDAAGIAGTVGVASVADAAGDTDAANTAAKKAALRRDALASRDGIPEGERETRSLEICERIERILAKHFGKMHPLIAVYCSMKSEVSLDALIAWCFEKTWKVCFPCMMKDPASKPMEFFTVDASQLAEHGEFPHRVLHKFERAELERLGFELVRPKEIDAIVVPMTAFDAQGKRLGYGGGNYDRYLPHLRKEAVVIGAAFSEQKQDAIPTDKYDLPLPLIVSA